MAGDSIHICGCTTCRSRADVSICRYHRQLNLLLSRLDEQQRRWLVGLESLRLGHGGEQQVAVITGVSLKTIRRGRQELQARLRDCPSDRVRRSGGGRPTVETRDPGLVDALEQLLEPETAGDPQGSGKYKRSSLRQLSECLTQSGHPASTMTVARLLKQRGYSLRVNARRKEARASPLERDTQFRHIQAQKQDFLRAGAPVISVDTKKKS